VHREKTVKAGQKCTAIRRAIDAEAAAVSVGIGDTIRARLTCKRKTDRPSRKDQAPQGVVARDVEVTNQAEALVASFDIPTRG